MVIEINKDIDRYKESVVMGLTAKQLIFSVASVVAAAAGRGGADRAGCADRICWQI